MVNHIAVATSVIVPAHLQQSQKGNLVVVVFTIVVMQGHMRNALVCIHAEHSEIICDLLQQSEIGLSDFSPYFIL